MRLPWTTAERKVLSVLSNPVKIQHFLDRLPYSHDDLTRSPRSALRVGRVHCFDGALLAAAAIEFHGGKPRIVDLRAEQDDDHVFAVFQRNGAWGAVAKSNYSGLRYREPVYRSLRELSMSYFEGYFNLRSKRSLREYSLPFDLRGWRKFDWHTHPASVDELGERLDRQRHFRILTPQMERGLTRVDTRSVLAGTLGLKKKKR